MYRHWNSWSDYSYSHISLQDSTEILLRVKGYNGRAKFDPYCPLLRWRWIAWSPDGNLWHTQPKGLMHSRRCKYKFRYLPLWYWDCREINISEGNKGYADTRYFLLTGWRLHTRAEETDMKRILTGFLFTTSKMEKTWDLKMDFLILQILTGK